MKAGHLGPARSMHWWLVLSSEEADHAYAAVGHVSTSALYSSKGASHASLFQHDCSVSDFFASCDSNACGGFIRVVFLLGAIS